MKLDRVTITGADDSVKHEALWVLAQEFPFVEWGILVSYTQEGLPRFPSAAWLHRLHTVQTEALKTGQGLRLSLHVCGRWVRQLLEGDTSFSSQRWWLLDICQRIQLNFHADPHRLPATYPQSLAPLKGKQVIFQLDGVNHEAFVLARDVLDAVPLFDRSGGAGILPNDWPRAEYLDATPATPGPHGLGVEHLIYHGYAGGLGPDNLAEQIPRIASAAGSAPFWIDMERKARSPDDVVLDLDKVRRCLEIAAPNVQPPEAVASGVTGT